MSYADELADLIGAASDMVPGTFEWGSPLIKYDCSGSVQEEGRLLSVGGFSTSRTATVNIRFDLLTAGIPQSQQTCKFNGILYRIESSRVLTGAFLQLDLIDPTKGA